MSATGHERLDHTADVGFEAWAPTLPELFAEAARAFVDSFTRVERVRPVEERAIELEAAAPDLLLHAWLEELLFLFDTEELVLVPASIDLDPPDDPRRLRATVAGERFDDRRHGQRVQVKAVTYHGLEVQRASGGWRARVILDI